MSEITFTEAAGIDKAVAESPHVMSAARAAAEAIAAKAISTAEVDTGAYRDSIVVEDFHGGARVLATDKKAAIIEFGAPGIDLPATHNLRRAAASLGFKFKKSSHG